MFLSYGSVDSELYPDRGLPASGVGRRRTVSWVFVFQICDIAINWAGGLHHAKKFEVSEDMMGKTVATLG